MTAQNKIDLSKLPPPDFITDLSFETIFNEMVAEVKTIAPDWESLESDFTTKVLQICAYKILISRQEKNEETKQNLVAYAKGARLDFIGANLLVTRLEGEIDEDFRARITLAQDEFSTGGPRAAYVSRAKRAHNDVGDVRVLSPDPCEVEIIVTGKTQLEPTPAAQSAILSACNAEDFRPLTDFVQVIPAEIIDFSINATLITYSGIDPQIVLESATQKLNSHLSTIRKIGHDITESMIKAALGVPGVQKVILNNIGNDIIITDYQIGNCTEIILNLGGTGE